MDLKNSPESKYYPAHPNSSTLAVKLDNPIEKRIPTAEEISTSSEENNMKLNKKNMKDIYLDQKVIKIQESSPCLRKLMDMKNSLSSNNEISQSQYVTA
ncbi:hypothetical protein TNCV_400181 [Trichonephila clavipes]|nr:hypothetical protein TNCV_400181 [Trichonephila clavipes]